MSIVKDIKEIKNMMKDIIGENTSTLEEQYKEYKFFVDSRGMKMLAEQGLVDEYNSFMSECENILFNNISILDIELPQPSDALEKFKNRFNKFF